MCRQELFTKISIEDTGKSIAPERQATIFTRFYREPEVPVSYTHLPNSDSEGKDSVDLIRDSLFSIQVQQPWLLLQFGNSNAEEIGTDRVEAVSYTHLVRLADRCCRV